MSLKMRKVKRICSAVLSASLLASSLLAFSTSAAVESRKYGDMNGDGEINSGDGTLFSRHMAKWDVKDKIDLKAGDLNGDSDVNSADATILARYLAKWNLTDCRVGEDISGAVDVVTIPKDKATISIKSEASMEKGQSETLTFDFAAEEEPETVHYTYRSSNGDIVDISAGADEKATMTAKAVGVSTVTVTAWMTGKDGETSNVSKSFDVTVTDSTEKITFGAGSVIRPVAENAGAAAETLKNAVSGLAVSNSEAASEIVLSVGDVAGIATGELRDEGYVVKADGEKVYVAARTGDGLDRGVRYLAKYYTADGVLSVAKNTDVTFALGHHIKDLTIAGNSVSDYEIVMPDVFTPSIETAVDRLRMYLDRVVGFAIDVKKQSEADPNQKHIFLTLDPTSKIAVESDGSETVCASGDSNAAFKITPSGYYVVESFGDLSNSGYTIRTEENGDVTIIGGPRAGILYGVFEFLEEFVGMRFIAAGNIQYYGAMHADIPAGITHTEVSPFEYRYSFDYGSTQDMAELLVARKLNASELGSTSYSRYGDAIGSGITGHGHSFSTLITEYFEQGDPKRGTLGKDIFLDTQPCLSNEENFQECLRNCIAIIEDLIQRKNLVPGEPGLQQLTIFYNDNEKFHKCRNCTAINNEENGSGSGTLVRFVNRMAVAMRELYPGIDIFTLAYGNSNTRKAPVTKFEDNVVLCDCWAGCNNHYYDGKSCSEAGTGGPYRFQNIFESGKYHDWKAISPKVYTWMYVSCYDFQLAPMPYTYNAHYDMLWLAENGCVGIYPEGSYGEEIYGFEMAHGYLFSELQWNPYMTEEQYQALIEEYYRLMYGDGWHEILELMDMWIEAGDVLGCWLSNFSQPQEYLSVRYYAANQDKMLALVNAARAKANTAEQERLIDILKANIDFFALCGDYEAKYQNGDEQSKAAYTARYETMYDFVKANGFSRVPETSEITANPMKMYYGIDTIDPRWK